jgi:hypothetical protein
MKKSRKNLFNHDTPFKLSRAKIDLFLECPCCFYLDRKLGVAPPGGPPFTLNNAVDELWKVEFDVHRAAGTAHPIAVKNDINAKPFQHEKIDDWRNNRRGLTYLHEPTQLLISGALDEIWVTPHDELIVVDVKATSKQSEVNLDAEWQISYKRQMEIYQWLLERNGFSVSKIGYFIYFVASRLWNELCEEVRKVEIDTIILACTDLNVVINPLHSPIKIIDSSTALAEAIVYQRKQA